MPEDDSLTQLRVVTDKVERGEIIGCDGPKHIFFVRCPAQDSFLEPLLPYFVSEMAPGLRLGPGRTGWRTTAAL